MKISEQWLREWVDPRANAAEIAQRLTMAGLEVDGIETWQPAFSGVVVAEVLSVAPHEQAGALRVCEVSDGAGRCQVVCGAPNVSRGMKTALAKIGAELPGGRSITRSVIRGVASEGMLCSAAELDLGDDAEGLLVLEATAVAGDDLARALRLHDTVFDIGLTPNRGDCFSVLGVARDLAVLTGSTPRTASVAPFVPTHERVFPVTLAAPAGCARYAGRVITNIDPTSITPGWMRERLRRSGVRAIHPLVDVTNYVMLELGQPMHAFDFDSLVDGIVVRHAAAGETLTLLDGMELSLDAETLVIADRKRPVALAGVMGGLATAVTTNTVNVFLESAFFEPVALAGVARKHRLQTDASTRFERGVDPTGQARAIERATELIVQICGGAPGPTAVVESPEHIPPSTAITFRPRTVNRTLGTRIPTRRIERVLRALAMAVDNRETPWRVTPPPYRFDIGIEVDLVEEIARVVGYDSIPTTLPPGGDRAASEVADGPPGEGEARRMLTARGYFEAVTYSFIDPEIAARFSAGQSLLALANPISSEMTTMRPSLWPGLIAAAVHNINRQHEDLRLFEIGGAFKPDGANDEQVEQVAGLRCGRAHPEQWGLAPRDVDFFDIKQDVVTTLEKCGQRGVRIESATHTALHPGQCARVSADGRAIGFLGALHPLLQRRFDVDKQLFLFEFSLDHSERDRIRDYDPISRFPAVRRDLSVVVDEAVAAETCLAAVREAAGSGLRDLQLFDVYRGQGIDSGKKSLTLGLIFQVASSTLTDSEVDGLVANVLTVLRERVGGTLRK